MLIPLSVGLVLAILVKTGLALHGGQFEDLESEAERILTEDDRSLMPIKPPNSVSREQSHV
ncbi:MAG: cbb3-type cytochrome oxidase assembly protein CcoS [Betaproteobacteria bacterium]|nr:cbb3-type cytochrome oxidase assembly protein CcoS [Betaproteobacteria bacterium]